MNDLVIEKLSLRTKVCFINDIIAGTKKVERRMAMPFYTERLIHWIDKKHKKWDDVKQVKLLHLYVGNKPDSKFVDVKVTGTFLTEFVKEIPEGFDKGDLVFEFELGEVVTHN